MIMFSFDRKHEKLAVVGHMIQNVEDLVFMLLRTAKKYRSIDCVLFSLSLVLEYIYLRPIFMY